MDGTLYILGEKINYEFIRNSNIKNIYMKFQGDKLVVRSPSYMHIDNILEKHKIWILKHYRQIKETVRIFDKNSVVLSGKRYIAVLKQSQGGFGVEVTKDFAIVSARDHFHANRIVERWLRCIIGQDIESRTLEKCKQLGVKVNGVGLRRSKRWGTCTRKGNITYNPYLAALPNDIADYVISHEVSHLKEMNHSGKFWKAVGNLSPQYKAIRKQLHYYDNGYRDVFVGQGETHSDIGN